MPPNHIFFLFRYPPELHPPCVDLAISTDYWESLDCMHILRINLRDHAYGNEKKTSASPHPLRI
jgi:hypothetical protein